MKDGIQPLPSSDELRPVSSAEPRTPTFDSLLNPPEFSRLRSRLVRVFARRGCSIPEDLADETISRVLGKLPEIASTYEGDPLRFVHAVARNVYREHGRRPRTVSLEDRMEPAGYAYDPMPKEEAHECLERCLSRLSPPDSRLIREYYRYDEFDKVDRRKTLAAELSIPMNTLRIKAYRIRRRLSCCVLECAKKERRDREMPEMKAHFLHNEV
jgi:DNA-directed RNA polymerase specialized sigma24 family protein